MSIVCLGFQYLLSLFELDVLQLDILEFSRDRKMMSVLCSRNQLHVLFSKGAPESIISKCTTILCNGDGSVMPLTADIRSELDSMFNRLGFYHLSCNLHTYTLLCFVYLLPSFWGSIPNRKQ